MKYERWKEISGRYFTLLPAQEQIRDNLRRSYPLYTGPSFSREHDFWEDGDENLPASICDRNGEVVLALCKRCGLGEIELDEIPVCPGRP